MQESAEYILSAEDAVLAGVSEFAVLPTSQIPFSMEVRKICEGNSCRSFGKRWSCPTARGSYEDGVRECLSYKNLIVFNTCYPIEDSFDLEGMETAMRDFKKVCDRVQDIVQAKRRRFLILSNESCFRCRECTYPDNPCRFPERLQPSIEGFGILVGELAKRAGIRYHNGTNTVTYFGGVLY